MEYQIHFRQIPSATPDRWASAFWATVPAVKLQSVRPESSPHRPITHARLVYDDTGMAGHFTVQDRYVRAIQTELHSSVCTDSCVEFFVQPDVGQGYFNFEFNCGGTLLCSHVQDPTRTRHGFKKWQALKAEDAALIERYHTLPQVVDPEISEPVEWKLGFYIPFTVFERYIGPLGNLPGRRWRANFYKCGDRTSHPHWLSWSPVSQLNFHMPECFGNLLFINERECCTG